MRKLLLLIMTMVAIHATNPTYENVTRLYVATFDRTPDVAGLTYWVNDSGLALENIARSFFDQPETKAKYYPNGTLYVPSFVEEVYINLFDRLPDDAGKQYWVDEIMAGGFSQASVFILAVINGAQGNDAIIVANKTEAALDEIRDQLPDISAEQSAIVNVPSDGSSSSGIQLYPDHVYSIVVYDTFQYKGYDSVASACRAIRPDSEPVMFAQNNLGVLLDCSQTIDGSFGYESKQFRVAYSTNITFHIVDTYYSDNSGYLKAFVYDFGISNNNPAPISVDEAQEAHFVGTFAGKDPGRTYEQYHSILYFKSDKTFTSKEWIDGSLREGKGIWKFDSDSTTFEIDWTPGGYFSGPVSGDTNTFTLRGTWSNGLSGTIEFTRQ